MKEESSPRADDLKLITGIGPKIERRLHDAGVLTYLKLAQMSPTDLAELLDDFAGMSAARIEEQGWISQARDLAPEQASAEQGAEEAPGNGQHYATFRIELLLDEENEVRRTHVDHIQGEKEQSWAGWDGDRLLDFIVQQASLQDPSTDAARLESRAESGEVQQQARPVPVPATMRSSLDPSQKYRLRARTVNPRRMTLVRAERAEEDGPAAGRKAHRTPEISAPIAKMLIIPAGEQEPSRVMPHDQPFSARLTLQHPERVRRDAPLDYTASLFATEPGGTQAQPVGEAQGTLAPGQADIEVGGRIASPGTYRLEAHLNVAGVARLSTTLRGGFVHVY